MRRLCTTQPKLARQRRGGALYLTVVSTTLIVSVMAITALSIIRIERKRSANLSDIRQARTNAKSGVTFAIANIEMQGGWLNGSEERDPIEGDVEQFAGSDSGSLHYSLREEENGDLWLTSKGVAGGATQIVELQVERDEVESESDELQSNTDNNDAQTESVTKNRQWCQFIKPELPVDAIHWRLTGIHLVCRQKNWFKTLIIRVVQPDASNWPTDDEYDATSINSFFIGGNWDWRYFSLNGSYNIPAGEGACIVLTSTSGSAPIEFQHSSVDVTDGSNALIYGDPDWQDYDEDRAFRYTAYGVYTTSSGIVRPIPGTWRWSDGS